MSESPRVRIGEWTAKPAQKVLERGDETVKLSKRAMQTLLYLARRPRTTVSLDELIDSIWNGVVVGNSSVHLAINQLRQTLDDDGKDPRYIETIPRRGFRLVAPVEFLTPRPGATGTGDSAARETNEARKA